jgi:hypothetical protein
MARSPAGADPGEGRAPRARGQPSLQHPLCWWGVNSTLSGRPQLNGQPGPHRKATIHRRVRFTLTVEMMTRMTIGKEVADQLLLSKSLLEKIRFQAAPNPDRFSLAMHILTAHNAAELALAAIASARSVRLSKTQPAMMDYLEALKTLHSGREVVGRAYFDRLNRVRNALKHAGAFPDPKQFANVAEVIYNLLSDLCAEYLEISLDDLDESALLTSATVKQLYDQAHTTLAEGKYKEVLEYLAQAMFFLFMEGAGLRSLSIGWANPTDAIKLTGFGVPANDYLTLQEFLPEVREASDGTPKIKWQQGEYGHPGNWRKEAATFCLKAFLDVALKIQGARLIPGPIDFASLYQHQVTAIQDEIEIWRSAADGTLYLPTDESDRVLVRRLKKGEQIRGAISRHKEGFRGLPLPRVTAPPFPDLGHRRETPNEEILTITWRYLESGFVKASEVKVTCIPRDDDFVRQYFPDLPEIPWEPKESG